jgi:hypothetical protein
MFARARFDCLRFLPWQDRPSPRSGWAAIPVRMGCSIALVLLALTASSAVSEKKAFDIPAGTAPGRLNEFSAQAGGHLLYSAETVNGAKTDAVKGVFTAREVIDRMLTGMGLVAKQDLETGALAIMPAAQADKNDGPAGNSPSAGTPSIKKTTA